MNDRTCFVLQQYRKGSEYNDFIGKFYHFSKKHIKQLSQPNIEFIYYEPKTKGDGVYFGYGKIVKTFEDKREPEHYFAEISGYKALSNPVPFLNDSGKQREQGPGFNIENSVRSVSPKELDEICLDGGIILNFTADAHLIKVLGEQLIDSEKVGILELVKNAYDAQASNCTVTIEKIDSLPQIDSTNYAYNEYEGPVIVIEDDGIGMTKETIEKGWLRPASTLKTAVKEDLKREKLNAIKSGKLGTYESLVAQLKKAYKNRIPLGEKGVGRFATHRLGRKLIIKTKIAELDYEYLLKIDWELFDKSSGEINDLDKIGISLTRQSPSRDYGKKGTGTTLIIYCKKDGFVWNEEIIRDLNMSLIRLNSPNPNPKMIRTGFTVALYCPQIPDLKKENILEDLPPVFTFDGLVDENGILDYSLKFQPPKSVPMQEEVFKDKSFNLLKSKKDYWKKSDNKDEFRNPECGAFLMHLDIWYREKPWMDGPNAKEAKDYLYDFGGISIYRDSINIFPAEWGTGTDWLELSQRQIKQTYRISYYHMLGNIEIDQVNNLSLVDMTNRRGLIVNTAYNDFKTLVETIIKNIVELEYIAKRDKYNALISGVEKEPKLLGNYAKQGAELVFDIRNKYPIDEDRYGILERFGSSKQKQEKLINLENSLKNLKTSLELIEENQELLTEQAGFGLSIAVSVHEMAKIASNFYMGVSHLLKSGKLDPAKLEDLKESSASFKGELVRLSPLRAVRTEKPFEFNISKAVKFVTEVFKNRLAKFNIKVLTENKKDFKIYARYGIITQMLSNLMDNSCYWLDGEKQAERKIIISIDAEYRAIIFADNGPGIAESISPYLFQAGYSLKMPPSGLGLYICKHYSQGMKGDIYLTTNKERIKDMKGAQFTLDFSKVPAEKEEVK